MADVTWFDGRRPPPPEELGTRVRAGVAAIDGRAEVSADLLRAGRGALEGALAQPGRVRGAAFDLLTADALVTYACEAALEGDDPDAELHQLVSIGGEM